MTPAVDDPAPSLVACQHLHLCSGCPAMGMPYQQQLAFKQQRVLAPILRYPQLAGVQVEPVIGSELQLEYRSRAKLMVAPDSSIGLFARDRDHQVVDLAGCRILTPLVASVVAGVRAQLSAGTLGLVAGRELVAVDVRETEGDDGHGALLTLVVRRDNRPKDPVLRQAARRLMTAVPQIRGVAANVRDARSIQVLGPQTYLLAGEGVVVDKLGESYHHATFGAFTQVNRKQAARVHEMVADAIGAMPGGMAGKRVLELYGGAGALGLGLARRGARVDMVESFAPAAQRAADAAGEQGLGDRFRALAGDAARMSRELLAAGARYDVVVVNPPRRGMSAATRSELARSGARSIGYVSCDPDTLARDLADLSIRGYRAESIRPLDMFPQTHEVESFAWLERHAPPPPAVLAEHERVVALAKAGHEQVDLAGVGRWASLAKERGMTVLLDKVDDEVSGVVLVTSEQGASALRGTVQDPESSEAYVVLCVGKVAARGRRGGSWRRLAVIGGHSLVRVERTALGGAPIMQELSRAGMRVVGDRRFGHEATNRYFEERHTLDRPFAHRLSVELASGALGRVWRAQAPLPGDLATVLVRLGGDETLAHPAVAPLLG